MSRIRARNTNPERLVFSYLRKRGIYFQKHYRRAPGVPDIALPGKKRAVFIDGEFWHGRQYGTKSKKWSKYWREKIAANIRRDRTNQRKLKMAGWRVLRIWDCDLEYKKRVKSLERIEKFLLEDQ